MSDTASRVNRERGNRGSNTGNESDSVPRALIHKRILDAAAENPGASMESLAADISGASVGLVSRVMEEYGDPASNGTSAEPPDESSETTSNELSTDTSAELSGETSRADSEEDSDEIESSASTATVERSTADPPDEQSMNSQNSMAETTDLTEKQVQTLKAIYEHPEATQDELADHLGTSRATISRRVNDIEGFDWYKRVEFVNALFGEETQPTDGASPVAVPAAEISTQITELTERVDEVAETVGRESPEQGSPFNDPDIAYKVVRACMNDDEITEEEEQRIVTSLLTSSP